jgi:predicted ferric reductase
LVDDEEELADAGHDDQYSTRRSARYADEEPGGRYADNEPAGRYADEAYVPYEPYEQEGGFGFVDDVSTTSVRRIRHDPPAETYRPAEVQHPAAEPRDRASRLTQGRGKPAPVADPEAAWDLRTHRMRVRLLKLVWTATFLVLVFAPLALAPGAGGERRPWSKGGIWVELCLTTGLLGLSTLAATIVLPSRVKSLTQAFGIEGVLRSHRWLGLATTVVVVAHVGFIVIDKPLNVLLLSPGSTGANRARAGLVATMAMILLCVLSFRRKKMGTRYDIWRWVHSMLALVALIGTYMHVYWLNHLMQNAAERTAFISILVGVSAIVINRWVRRPFASVRNAYQVKAVYQETPTVSTLVLTPVNRHRRRPMRYRPGQFAWIRLDSPFGPLQSNPFSLASGVDSPRDLEFTIRSSGDFTSQIGLLTVGRKVFVDGPYGAFNDDSKGSQSLLLIGAGVGLSPMMSILRSHAFRADRRPHVLVTAQKTPEELMFADELHQMQSELDLEVIEVVSQPPADWTGVTGWVDGELLAEILEAYGLRSASVFICGPPPMMDAAKEALVRLGVPARDVHTEQFDLV